MSTSNHHHTVTVERSGFYVTKRIGPFPRRSEAMAHARCAHDHIGTVTRDAGLFWVTWLFFSPPTATTPVRTPQRRRPDSTVSARPTGPASLSSRPLGQPKAVAKRSGFVILDKYGTVVVAADRWAGAA